ncbi:MAG TPA: DNA recombination protein RmuC, partial [Polyangia bacterium]|nr:DNA recombination protein RmuC [Polyangia bacterium]
VETRRQVHIIQEALGKLAREFQRFDERMKKLADHIRLAGTDVDDLRTTSRKISARFDEIERVELEPGQAAQPQLGGLAAGEEG